MPSVLLTPRSTSIVMMPALVCTACCRGCAGACGGCSGGSGSSPDDPGPISAQRRPPDGAVNRGKPMCVRVRCQIGRSVRARGLPRVVVLLPSSHAYDTLVVIWVLKICVDATPWLTATWSASHRGGEERDPGRDRPCRTRGRTARLHELSAGTANDNHLHTRLQDSCVHTAPAPQCGGPRARFTRGWLPAARHARACQAKQSRTKPRGNPETSRKGRPGRSRCSTPALTPKRGVHAIRRSRASTRHKRPGRPSMKRLLLDSLPWNVGRMRCCC